MRVLLLALFALACVWASETNSSEPVSAEIISLGPDQQSPQQQEPLANPQQENEQPKPEFGSDDGASDLFLPFSPFSRSKIPTPSLQILPQQPNFPPFMFAFNHNPKPIHSMTFEMDLPSFGAAAPSLERSLLGGLSALQSMPPLPQRQPFFVPHHQPLFHPFQMFSIPPPHMTQLPFSPLADVPSQPVIMPFHAMHPLHKIEPVGGLLSTILNQILDQPPQQIHELEEIPEIEEKPVESDKQEPMILNLTTRDNFYVVSGFFPGLTQENMTIKLDGSNFLVTGKLVDKSEETLKALGDLSEIDEVDETMELPYAPDAHLFKVHFDNSSHVLTAVFPKQQTTELSFS